jgi:hypothetical protein
MDTTRLATIAVSFRIALAAMAGLASSPPDDRQPPPVFEGDAIPQPPRQKEPWNPPATTLPNSFVSAASKLFEQGLADPRGCEYREIEVVAGSVWGSAVIMKTRGWVLPANQHVTRRFAVCWNGLGYPVVSVGAAADCRADVDALLRADRETVNKLLAEHDAREAEREKEAKAKGSQFRRFPPTVRGTRHATAEWHGLSHESMVSLKAVLLLRSGHADLAERLWEQWHAGNEPQAGADPYIDLARTWTWSLFDRAVCAHMRGDDKLALASARALQAIQPTVEIEAASRATDQQRRTVAPRGEKPVFFGFLKPLPALLADQERRAQQPKRPRSLEAGRENYPDNSKWIAALVEDLENVAARQQSQPGGVSLRMNAIVNALVMEGDDAVEPLIDCYEKDTRLTRSVQFGRDFGTDRQVIEVKQAASEALAGIFNTRAFGPDVRAYWKKFKGVPLEERWYRTLADDTANPRQWLDAAGKIVDYRDTSDPMPADWVSVLKAGPGEKRPLRGERLRDHEAPSVTELLAKRVASIAGHESGGRNDMQHMSRMQEACNMALYLAEWDSGGARPTLAEHVRRCQNFLAGNPTVQGWGNERLAMMISQLTIARVRAGDDAALADYATWLRSTNPWTLKIEFNSKGDLFEAMWRHPQDAAIRDAAAFLFNDVRSPWVPLIQIRKQGNLAEERLNMLAMVETPLVGVAGFREYLLRELSVNSEVGTVKLRGGNSVEIRAGPIQTNMSGGRFAHSHDPLAPPEGTEVAFRRCDLFAWQLGAVEGMPKCELYWPMARRHEAVSACIALLTQYGDRYQFSPLMRPDERVFGVKARLTFPPLDHPATPDDVRRGDAIFSLDGPGKTRLCPTPQLPLRASWLTLKDSPYLVQSANAQTGKQETRTEYDQRGIVWQAEEVLHDGVWQRWFGFVGRNRIARAPAAEIEFPADGWTRLSRQVDCLVSRPGVTDRSAAAKAVEFPAWSPLTEQLNRPLVITVWLRNRSGLDQRLPSTLLRDDPQTGPALHAGMNIHLSRARDEDAARRTGGNESDDKDWVQLEPKTRRQFKPTDVQKTVGPGEGFIACQLDLNNWFDITAPGAYRLRFTFDSPDGGFADGQSNRVTFSLEAP